jgi:5-methylcytosine-specific restriction endonuclease McrA
MNPFLIPVLPSAVASATDEHPTCEHPNTRLVRRVLANGVLIVIRQCARCGSNRGAVKKAEVPDLNALPPWNEALRDRWHQLCTARAQRRIEERERAFREKRTEWWIRYNEYLETPEWAARRDAVLRRDNYLCRGCRINRAVQVHHLTYDRVGREPLFDLVSVCLACHESIHAREDGA